MADKFDFSGLSDEDLDRVIESGGTWTPPAPAAQPQQMQQTQPQASPQWNNDPSVDTVYGDSPLEEAAKGAGRAAKAIGGAFVGLGSGAVRLAGTPVRALTGWDGLHRVADAIDSGYEDWGADALASELPDDDWGRVLGGFGEKIAGTAGSLGAMAAGGGLAKLGAAGKLGAASKAVGTAGAALQKSLPLIFGNDAAVRTYDTAKENGSGTARALGLASVNGAIHYFGFKAFENQSLNKMLGMPQEMTAMMPGWANAAREGGAKTFTELASGVRNGMYKYILAERAKGALKAGGIMGLQNFLSSVPTQMAEGAGVGDVDWGRAVSEGVGGVEEGSLMEALMGGAAALKTPKAARKFIADTYFRNGYKLPNGQHVPGLLHSEEGRSFVMKQNPEMQRRILDILDHGGKVTKGELNAACLPPDMTEAELREFKKDWKHDLEVEGWRKGEDEFLGDGEELTGSEDVRGQNAATTTAVEEERIAEEAMNADAPGNEPAPPIDAAMEERAKPLSAAEAEAQQRQLNDAAERNRAKQAARDAEPRIAALRQTRQESSEMGNRLEHQFDEANAQADAERNGAEQLAREEAYPRITVEQAQAARTEPSPVANGGAGTVLQEQIQRRIDAEARSEAGKKVQAEIDGFFDAVKGNRDVLGNEEFNARNADILADVDDAIRRNNPQMARDALNKLKKKVKNFAKKNRLRPATPEPPPEPPDGSEPSGGSKSNLLRRQQPRSATQSTNSLRPAATRDELKSQQPQQEKPNETGNVPVEAQPEPSVQDAGRGGQQPSPQAAERSVEVSAPRGEVPAAGEVAEARPAEAKPVAPAPAATQEQKPVEQAPVSKSDTGGQKLTGGAKEETTAPVARTETKPAERKWETNQELWDIVEGSVAPGEETTWGEIMKRTGLSLSEVKHAFAALRLGRVESKSKWGQAIGLDESKRVRRNANGSTSNEPSSAEPPKTAPASAQSADGTTTPPQSAEPPQGAESAAGGAAGGATEEPKPTQGNKLRRGKKGKKLEAQEPKADAAPAAPATQEATPEREPVFENEQLEKAYRMMQSGAEKDVRAGEDLALETISKMRGHELQKLYTMTPTDDAFEKIIDIATGEVNDRMISDEPIPEGTIPDRKDATPASTTADTTATTQKTAPKLKPGRKAKPKASATPATPEATTVPTAAEQPQPDSQFRDKNGNMKKTLRGAVERIASAIGNRTGKGVITPEEADGIVNGIAESPEAKHNRTRQFFTPLVTDAEWQNSLGVDAESAKNLRDAVARAKTDSEMAHFFVQVDKAVKKAKAGKLSPKDAVPLNGKISEGLEKAEREGRAEAAKRLREALEVIKPVVDAVSQEDVDKFNRSAKGKKLHTQLDGSDRRRGSRGKTVSLDTKDGTVDVGADGRTLEDVADEISDSSHDRRTLKPGESYGKGFTAKSDNDTTGTEGTRQGSTGKGGGRGGNRVLRIEEIDGDDVFVSLLDSTGRERGEPQKMTREQWEMLAKAGKSLNDADPSNPQVGDNIMMSRGNAESPASRDAKFAADADYQRWLKARKANDAEPLRQRYEMEQAKALGDAYQNAVRGVDFEYVDRDYDPAKDGGGDGRKSVGGIYTGTAADYANRSRRGGVDDGPSVKHIGTGEGSQVYGWGLYGSNVRGVADRYAKNGRGAGGKDWIKEGRNHDELSDVEKEAASYLKGMGSKEGAIERLKEDIEWFEKQGIKEEAEALKPIVEELSAHGDEYREQHENVYEQTFFTDRAPGDESHLLKWYDDSSQSFLGTSRMSSLRDLLRYGDIEESNKKKLREVVERLENYKPVKGHEIYEAVAYAFGNGIENDAPKKASEWFATHGIDGVKYPVDSYGGKGVKDGDEAGWNYVSFRDDNIRVDHKWEDGNLRYLRERGTGTVLGIFDRDTGKLKLFRGASWKTLNHELGGHATMRLAEQEAERGNRALLDKINEAVDGAMDTPLADEVRSRYPDADEATLRDEIWAALRERPSEAMQKYVKTLQGRKWYNRAWDAIKTAWRGILSRMGFNRADLSGIDKMTPDEFNEFLDNAMIGGKTLGRIETQGGDGIGNKLRKAFIGERGAEAGEVEKTVGIRRVDDAKKMEAEGASREDIWRKTGWWRGKDGKWRVEIPDLMRLTDAFVTLRKKDPKYANELINRESKGRHILIDNLFQDDPTWQSLVKAYPQIKGLLYRVDKSLKAFGSYSPLLNLITFSDEGLYDSRTFVHELQHAIQHYEGFARGGSLLDARNYIARKHPALIAARNEVERIGKDSGYESWAATLSGDDIRAFKDEYKRHTNLPLFMYYAQRVLPLTANGRRMYDMTMKAIRKLDGETVRAEADDQSKNLSPYNIYRAFAGEVESRNVEKRFYMTPEERAATPPWATEDVPESEQIVRTGDGGGASESRSGRQSSVRMARGPVTPGPDVRIMDDEVKWLDRQGERFVDSTHNLRKVQNEVGYRDRLDPKSVGVEEVMDPKTGFVDWRKSSDIHKAIVKSNGFVQKNEHILQVRRDRATREMAKMKGLSEDAKRELVDNYLTALHAEERNRTIADRRGDTYNDDYAEGAGRSAKWARDFIANDPNVQKYKAELNRIADIVHEAVVEDLRLRHENGLLSDDEYNFYSKKWKHYVPLRTDVTEGSPEGGAFNTSTATFNRSEYRTAKGRGADNIASSPFAFAFVQAHDGIGKSARNIIGNVTANFIDMTEAKGLNSTKVEVVAKDGSKSTKTEYRIAEVVPADVVKRGGTKFAATFADGTTAEIGSDMRLASHQDNLVLFKRPEPVIGKDGKPTGETAARLYVAKFTEGKNGRGLAVAKAITGKNMVEVPFWVQPFSKATHFLSRMNTSASPSFLTSNIFNDRNEAWRAMSARFGVLDGAKMAAKVWKYRYADGKDLKNWLDNGELRPGSDVADFINGGAAIKGGNIAQGFSGETSSLKDNLARQERKARSWWERFKRVGRFENVREIASSVGDVVQSANELEELGTRYGVYHAVLDELVAKGVPREVAKAEAVTFCRGATTDFNVRGTLAPVIGSFYMFYNANVQGTRRNIQSLTDKRGVQTFATLAGVASAMTVLRYWLGNDEDREKGGGRNAKNALEYQKQSAMGIPIPSGRELSILKMRGVDALIPYAATKFTEAALYDDVSAMEALADSLKAVGGEALGVLGGNGVGNKSQISQTLAPSLADPFVQWATGTDWQGERRVKQLMDKTVPQSYNARHGTSDVFKWIAETVNDISGGNQYRKGVVDMAPEDVQLIVETLAGGLGRDITGAINTFSNVKEVAKGGSSERLFGRMPVVKSLVREYPDSTSRYFDALDEYNADKAEFKKTTELGRRAEMKKEHPYLTAKKGRVDALIEQVKELTHRERGEVKVGQKWVQMRTELPEARKEAFRKRRMRLQAEVLRILGK